MNGLVRYQEIRITFRADDETTQRMKQLMEIVAGVFFKPATEPVAEEAGEQSTRAEASG